MSGGRDGLPDRIAGLSEVASRYDGIVCDIWGVVHNGLAAHSAACDALARYREGGGSVVLVTNAPRPWPDIRAQLDGLRVPRDCYDAIVTSGDMTLELIAAYADAPLYHLGPARDLPLFETVTSPRVPLDEARLVVCTGLFHDETETPADYADTLRRMRSATLPMICANPDLVVERGDRLVFCAGALGQAYEELGGAVTHAGKPHAPIYERAFGRLAEIRGAPVPRDRLLAIGDAIRTDIAGAVGMGIDALFVTAGIHAHVLHDAWGGPDEKKLAAFLAETTTGPRFYLRVLAW